MTTNEKRWDNLLNVTTDYVSLERVEAGLDKGLFSHIAGEAETLGELLEALDQSEVPKYVVFGLDVPDYEGFLAYDEYGILVDDHSQIEESAVRFAKEGREVDAYNLDTGKSVRLDIRLNPSVRVIED